MFLWGPPKMVQNPEEYKILVNVKPGKHYY